MATCDTPYTQEQARADTRVWVDKILSDDPGLYKQAADKADRITKLMLREDGVYRMVFEPETVGPSQLAKSVNIHHPHMVCELEPRSPAAMTLPIGGGPPMLYIRAVRYPVIMRRRSTWKFTVDVADLLTWDADLRRIIGDNSTKDLQASEDAAMYSAIDVIVGAAGSTVFASNSIQHKAITGPFDQNSFAEAFKVLPSLPASLSAEYCIINNVTVWDMVKVTTVQMAEQIQADIIRKGWTLTEYLGRKLIVTIKKALVPNGVLYMLANKDAVGRAFQLEEATLHVKKDGHMVSMYTTTYGGAAIGNTSGVAKAAIS